MSTEKTKVWSTEKKISLILLDGSSIKSHWNCSAGDIDSMQFGIGDLV
jgi:hypothetical protein